MEKIKRAPRGGDVTKVVTKVTDPNRPDYGKTTTVIYERNKYGVNVPKSSSSGPSFSGVTRQTVELLAPAPQAAPKPLSVSISPSFQPSSGSSGGFSSANPFLNTTPPFGASPTTTTGTSIFDPNTGGYIIQTPSGGMSSAFSGGSSNNRQPLISTPETRLGFGTAYGTILPTPERPLSVGERKAPTRTSGIQSEFIKRTLGIMVPASSVIYPDIKSSMERGFTATPIDYSKEPEVIKRGLGLAAPITTLLNPDIKESTIRGVEQAVATERAIFTPGKYYEGYEEGKPKITFQLPGTKKDNSLNIIGQFFTPQNPVDVTLLTVGGRWAPKATGLVGKGVAIAGKSGLLAVEKVLGPSAAKTTFKIFQKPVTKVVLGFGGMAAFSQAPKLTRAASGALASKPVKEYLAEPDSKQDYTKGTIAAEEAMTGRGQFLNTMRQELESQGVKNIGGFTELIKDESGTITGTVDSPASSELDNMLIIAERESLLGKKWDRGMTPEQRVEAEKLRNVSTYKTAYEKALQAKDEGKRSWFGQAAAQVNVAFTDVDAFKKGVADSARERYKAQGYTGIELERKVNTAVNAQSRMLSASSGGQAASYYAISATSETLGQSLGLNVFRKGGVTTTPFKTTFKKLIGPLGLAGAGEGASIYFGQQSAKQQEVKPLDLALYTATGAGSAIALGGLIAGLGAKGAGATKPTSWFEKGGKIGVRPTQELKKKLSEKASTATLWASYLSDWWEKAGDFGSSIARKAGAAHYGRTPFEAAVEPTKTGLRYVVSGGKKIPIKATAATAIFTPETKAAQTLSNFNLPETLRGRTSVYTKTRTPTSVIGAQQTTSTVSPIDTLFPTVTPVTTLVPVTTPVPVKDSTDITQYIYTPVDIPVETPISTPVSTPISVDTPIAITTAVPLGLGGVFLPGGEVRGGRGKWSQSSIKKRRIADFSKEIFGTAAERASFRGKISSRPAAKKSFKDPLDFLTPTKTRKAATKKSGGADYASKINMMLGR